MKSFRWLPQILGWVLKLPENGPLVLQGGAEFGGQMRDSDIRALELAGGAHAPVRIIPTAAAPDNNQARAGQNGVRWFEKLGAKNVTWLLLIDKASANSADICAELLMAKFIYLLGGFTHYLGQTLRGSSGWDAALQAHRNGAVIAGSSAGSMVLCEYYFDPGAGRIEQGLNLVPNALVLPHYNAFGKSWAPGLLAQMPHLTLLGLDERTGMLSEAGITDWHVLGQGGVTLYRQGRRETVPAGGRFSL